MSRYIDADLLSKETEESMHLNPHKDPVHRGMHAHEHRHFLLMISKQPEVDVVPVVRCKDCLYSYKVDSREPMYDCRHICRWGCNQWLGSDDFCSYGERKEERKIDDR